MLLTGCTNNFNSISSSKQSNNIVPESDTSFKDSISKDSTSSSENTQTESMKSLSGSQTASVLSETSQKQDILSSANNNNNYHQLIQTVPFKKFCRNYLYYGILHDRSCVPSLGSINKDSNIQCLRKISDSRYYCIYKTDNGGLFYCFFNNCFLYNAIFSLKTLNYSNFSSIKIGSSLEAVNAIDPIVSEIQKVFQSNNDQIRFSKHLLKDGLLIISYRQNNGKFIVSNMAFYPDFKVKETVQNRHSTYDYSILPQDYID